MIVATAKKIHKKKTSDTLETAFLEVLKKYHQLRVFAIPEDDPLQLKIKPLGCALKELSREIGKK